MNRDCDYNDEELIALLKGARAGQEEAMRCMLRGGRLKQAALGFLLKEGARPQDAEDAYSDGLRVFFMNVINHKFEGGGSPKTYFMAICKNVWLGKKKGAWNRRISFFENAVEMDRPDYVAPDSELRLDSLKQRINQLLGLTGQRCKDMYWLDVNGYSQAEIAEMTGQSNAANVKNAYYRCRQRLKEIIASSPDLTNFFKKYLDGE